MLIAELGDEAMEAVPVGAFVSLSFLFQSLLYSTKERVGLVELDRHDKPEREIVTLGDHRRVVGVVLAGDHVAQVRDLDELADRVLGRGHDADGRRRQPRGDDAELPEAGEDLGQPREDAGGVRRGGGDIGGADQGLERREGAADGEARGVVVAARAALDEDAARLQVDMRQALARPRRRGPHEVVQHLRLVEAEVLALVEDRVAAQVGVDAPAHALQAREGAGLELPREPEGAFPLLLRRTVDGDVRAREAGLFVDLVAQLFWGWRGGSCQSLCYFSWMWEWERERRSVSNTYLDRQFLPHALLRVDLLLCGLAFVLLLGLSMLVS